MARLLTQTPLLLAVLVAALSAQMGALVSRKRAALTWEGNLPEVMLVAGVLGALAVNPTPYPYNLLHVVPYAFILAFRYVSGIWDEIWSRVSLRPLVIATVIFAHFIPFGVATRRHFDFANLRQERLMNLAEDLTDPRSDPVYDGIGMVPTRSTIGFNWYLHSLNIQSFTTGPGPRVRDMLAARPAAVIIPSYRTDWLPKEDHAFIRKHYVPLADDFWVLGSILPAGGGTFEISHPGRYRISTVQGSDLDGTYQNDFAGVFVPEQDGSLAGTMDGKPLTQAPVELSIGTHRIECASNCQPAVVWMGPRLQRVHRIGPGDHRFLFVNWY